MKGDRLFYTMWGLVLIFLGLAAALYLFGYSAEGILLFFAGPGITLSILGKADPFKFYGGIVFVLLGILIYSFMGKINPAFTLIAIIIIIGGLIVWHGFGGEKSEGS